MMPRGGLPSTGRFALSEHKVYHQALMQSAFNGTALIWMNPLLWLLSILQGQPRCNLSAAREPSYGLKTVCA